MGYINEKRHYKYYLTDRDGTNKYARFIKRKIRKGESALGYKQFYDNIGNRDGLNLIKLPFTKAGRKAMRFRGQVDRDLMNTYKLAKERAKLDSKMAGFTGGSSYLDSEKAALARFISKSKSGLNKAAIWANNKAKAHAIKRARKANRNYMDRRVDKARAHKERLVRNMGMRTNIFLRGKVK